MNRILEYIIQAKDYTREAVEKAKSRVREFAAQVKTSLAETEKKAKATTERVSQDAQSSVNPMELIFNAMHGNIEGTIKAFVQLGREMDGFREVMTRISGVIVNEVGGAINTALKGLVSGAEKAGTALKGLGLSITSLSGVTLVIAGMVKVFQLCSKAIQDAKDRAKEMAEAVRNAGLEAFARYISAAADAQKRWADEIHRTNAEIGAEASHSQTMTNASAAIDKARLEAQRQAELSALSVTDTEGRDAVNARYDDAMRRIDADARTSGQAEAESALEAQRRELEAQQESVNAQINRNRELLKDAVFNANHLGNTDQQRKDASDQAEKLRALIESGEADMRSISAEIDAIDVKLIETRKAGEAAAAQEAAETARIERERLDAAESRANAEWDAYEAEMEAYEAERERLEAEAAEETRRRIDEETRMREDMERRLHDERVGNIQAEMAAQSRAQGEAEGRLAAAKSQLAQAWGWYRDPTSMQGVIDNAVAQREAEARFEKDFERLRNKARGRFDWRTVEIGKLSAEEEATRQVALAKEAEEQAKKDLAEIAENTRDLAEKLDELMAMKE